MEATLEVASPQRARSIDWTAPVSIAMALLLAVLVLLPMAWLVVTSLRDAAKAFTLDHYRHLFVDPAFVKPLVTTLWTSAAVGTICVITAAPMAWLVARTDLPGQAADANADSGFVRHAAVSRRVRMGAARRTQRRAAEQVVLRAVRFETVRRRFADQHLLRLGHGVRDGALHVSVRVHVCCEQSRCNSERARRGVLHPRRSCMADRSAHHAAAGRCRRCLPDFWWRFCSR